MAASIIQSRDPHLVALFICTQRPEEDKFSMNSGQLYEQQDSACCVAFGPIPCVSCVCSFVC